MRDFIFILFCCFSTSALSAQDYQGKIVDSSTGEKLAYVNVGIVGKGVGTVSNLEGEFVIPLDKKYDKDTLQLSMIGYASKQYIVQDFKNELAKNNTIALKAQATEIEEVIVESTRFKKEKVLGNKTTSQNMTGGYENDKLGNEVGIIIRIRKSPTYVKAFNASIVENTYGLIRFRLNFYSIKNGKPDKILLKENIIVETDIENGIFHVDLSPYEIIVEDDFFVSLEWIEDFGKDGLHFSFALFGKPIIVRETSQAYWYKIPPLSIGFNVEVKY